MKINELLLMATIVCYAITPVAAAWLIHRLIGYPSAFKRTVIVAGIFACMLVGYALSSNM